MNKKEFIAAAIREGGMTAAEANELWEMHVAFSQE